jgi:hypothetical protein
MAGAIIKKAAAARSLLKVCLFFEFDLRSGTGESRDGEEGGIA